MTSSSAELAHEMAQPVFTNYDLLRPIVIVRKDYEEGSRAMWREYERFATENEARQVLRQIRDNQAAYEDRTGIEPMSAFKIVQQPS